MEYHLAIKRKGLLLHTTRMEGITLSEKCQSHRRSHIVMIHFHNTSEMTKLERERKDSWLPRIRDDVALKV